MPGNAINYTQIVVLILFSMHIHISWLWARTNISKIFQKFQIARLKVDIKNVSNIYFPWHCNETHYTVIEMDIKGAD